MEPRFRRPLGTRPLGRIDRPLVGGSLTLFRCEQARRLDAPTLTPGVVRVQAAIAADMLLDRLYEDESGSMLEDSFAEWVACDLMLAAHNAAHPTEGTATWRQRPPCPSPSARGDAD